MSWVPSNYRVQPSTASSSSCSASGNSSRSVHRSRPWTPPEPQSRRMRRGHSPTGLRGGIDGDVPAVLLPPLVPPPSEVPDEQVAAHLQVSHRALEVLLPAFAESGLPLEFKGEAHSSLVRNWSMIRFCAWWPAPRPSGCRSRSRSAASWQSGEPRPGDESGFPDENIP